MKNFLIDIDSDHFENYFRNEIEPCLLAAESERLKANRVDKYLWPVVAPLFFFGLIIGTICEIDADSLLYRFLPENIVNSVIMFSTFILIFFVLVSVFYNRIYYSKRKSVEDFLYCKLLSYIGDFKYKNKGSLFSSINEIKSCIQESYLFGKINRFCWYDAIYGTFNGNQIEVCEIKLTPYEFIEDVLCKEYRGLFISTKTDLNLASGISICKKDLRIKIKPKNNIATFKTGNVAFDKFFDVYTTNLSAANKILTQYFIKEFLNIYYELGLSISCAFKNNNLYILILNDEKKNKDWFSFEHSKKSYLDFNTFKGILKDFLSVLKVVNSFQEISKQNKG